MKTLLVNFAVDKAAKKIRVEREFAAPLAMVWSAWTETKHLEKWWAPKPWRARTSKMDFKAGGSWLYAMVGPEGEEHFGKMDYKTVVPMKSFSGLDGFCDANGVLNKDLPQNEWMVAFSEKNGVTRVDVSMAFTSLADLEKIIEMGFKEGFLMAMENLDELLTRI